MQNEGENYIHSLAVVTKPIAEIDALDIKLGEFLVGGTVRNESEEHILNVTMLMSIRGLAVLLLSFYSPMAPVRAFNLRDGSNITSSKGM
jgi:hypothetical protein